ncbi:MAG: thioredoxin domain-containing protein [Microcoleus sp. SIO2G3]|nr:thioredoxin domain-containing protein [Microcoleus sp. SIO2G3]
MASGRFADAVRHDVRAGQAYGIRATPTVFVNNANLEELSVEGLKKLIEKSAPKP